MEASATTVNIQSPAVSSDESKHNHKPNFGRYVADCPRCRTIYPDGPPVRGKKAKASPAELTTLTREQILAILREEAPSIPSGNSDLQQLVQLMLAKEAKVLQKEQDDEKRRLAAREDMLKAAREHEAMIAANQAACGHVKENGRTAINGQIHNDGFYHPFCQRCFKMFTPRRPTHEEMPTAIN